MFGLGATDLCIEYQLEVEQVLAKIRTRVSQVYAQCVFNLVQAKLQPNSDGAAAYREYLPFHKSEFKVGMILRMNIHESDFKGTSKAAIAQASQASTLVDGGRRRKEHRHHGDYGPIYSENRIFIVVNVAEDVYTAIPLFTHEGKGLANIRDKKSWVSVEDHRRPGKCTQQSEHQPLRTAFLSPECEKLDPVSAAWIPFAYPCRYDVPVAYQGKLDKVSAKRLVRLHRDTWVDDVDDQSDED